MRPVNIRLSSIKHDPRLAKQDIHCYAFGDLGCVIFPRERGAKKWKVKDKKVSVNLIRMSVPSGLSRIMHAELQPCLRGKRPEHLRRMVEGNEPDASILYALYEIGSPKALKGGATMRIPRSQDFCFTRPRALEYTGTDTPCATSTLQIFGYWDWPRVLEDHGKKLKKRLKKLDKSKKKAKRKADSLDSERIKIAETIKILEAIGGDATLRCLVPVSTPDHSVVWVPIFTAAEAEAAGMVHEPYRDGAVINLPRVKYIDLFGVFLEAKFCFTAG